MLYVFEGIDGAGKSTVVQEVAERLRKKGLKVETTFEPGNTSFGTDIRDLLLGDSYSLDSFESMCLFLADRSHHIRTKVEPWLTEGKIVLSDRMYGSTMVYQGYMSNPLEKHKLPDIPRLYDLNMKAIDNVTVQNIFFMDVTPTVAKERLSSRGETNKIDMKPVEYFERMRKAYKDFLNEYEQDKTVTVDADREVAYSVDMISKYILKSKSF